MSGDLRGLRGQRSPYRVPVFHKTLIVSTQTDEEENARHVLETMNPLPPLALLATHINHQHFMVPQIEARFCNADCPSPTVNNVLFVGQIMRIKEPVQIREVIVQAVWNVGKRSEQPGERRRPRSDKLWIGTHFSGSAASLPLEQAF